MAELVNSDGRNPWFVEGLGENMSICIDESSLDLLTARWVARDMCRTGLVGGSRQRLPRGREGRRGQERVVV